MSSDIGSPATLPVQPSSETTSPVFLGPLALELVTDRPVSVYQYNGATHCREFHRPKKYDHIGWQCGLVDGYKCQCSKSPSPPENTPVEKPTASPTPQLAHHTIPFPEKEDKVFSSMDYEESNKENEHPFPHLGSFTTTPDTPSSIPSTSPLDQEGHPVSSPSSATPQTILS